MSTSASSYRQREHSSHPGFCRSSGSTERQQSAQESWKWGCWGTEQQVPPHPSPHHTAFPPGCLPGPTAPNITGTHSSRLRTPPSGSAHSRDWGHFPRFWNSSMQNTPKNDLQRSILPTISLCPADWIESLQVWKNKRLHSNAGRTEGEITQCLQHFPGHEHWTPGHFVSMSTAFPDKV